MSVRALTWAWQQKVADPEAKLVLLKLADQANDDGECWPARRSIGDDCEMSIQTVQRRIRVLRERGLVEVKPRLDHERRGRQTSNLYRLIFDPLVTRDPGVTPDQGAGISADAPPCSGQTPLEPLNGSSTSSPDGEDAAEPPIERLGHDFVGFFVDEVRRVVGRDPLPNARGRIGRHANELRRQGLDETLIRRAITEVVEAGLNVGSLLTVADQLHRGGYRGRQSNGLSARDIFNLDLEAV